MTSISLIDGLRIVLRFADSSEIGGIIKKTVDELARLYELEKHATNLAYAIKRDQVVTEYSRAAADEVLRLADIGSRG